jgi:hypothetical protein
LSLFPGIQDDPNTKYHVRSLLTDAADVFMTDATWNIGFMARSRLYLHTGFREIGNLPQEVSHIDVKVIKFTASSFALCLDVKMTDKVDQKLLALQSKIYYPLPLSFATRFKWAVLHKGFEVHIPQARQEVLRYLEDFRSELETSISKYFSGYFLRQPKVAHKTRLSAVEVFALKGEPIDENKFTTWSHDTRGWWDTFGLDLDFSPFRNDVLFFNWAWESRIPDIPATAHRLIFLGDTFLARRHESLHDNVEHELEAYLDELTPLITVQHYIESVRKRVGVLKVSAVREMQFRWWSWFWPRMRRLIKLSNTLQQESMMMDRLSIDWGAKAKQLTETKHKLRFMGNISTLKFIRESPELEQSNLNDDLLRGINEEIEGLTRQLSHLRTWYAEHLVSRNTWVTYGLTVVVGIATIVGLISIREDILKFIKQVWGLFR